MGLWANFVEKALCMSDASDGSETDARKKQDGSVNGADPFEGWYEELDEQAMRELEEMINEHGPNLGLLVLTGHRLRKEERRMRELAKKYRRSAPLPPLPDRLSDRNAADTSIPEIAAMSGMASTSSPQDRAAAELLEPIEESPGWKKPGSRSDVLADTVFARISPSWDVSQMPIPIPEPGGRRSVSPAGRQSVSPAALSVTTDGDDERREAGPRPQGLMRSSSLTGAIDEEEPPVLVIRRSRSFVEPEDALAEGNFRIPIIVHNDGFTPMDAVSPMEFDGWLQQSRRSHAGSGAIRAVGRSYEDDLAGGGRLGVDPLRPGWFVPVKDKDGSLQWRDLSSELPPMHAMQLAVGEDSAGMRMDCQLPSCFLPVQGNDGALVWAHSSEIPPLRPIVRPHEQDSVPERLENQRTWFLPVQDRDGTVGWRESSEMPRLHAIPRTLADDAAASNGGRLETQRMGWFVPVRGKDGRREWRDASGLRPIDPNGAKDPCDGGRLENSTVGAFKLVKRRSSDRMLPMEAIRPNHADDAVGGRLEARRTTWSAPTSATSASVSAAGSGDLSRRQSSGIIALDALNPQQLDDNGGIGRLENRRTGWFSPTGATDSPSVYHRRILRLKTPKTVATTSTSVSSPESEAVQDEPRRRGGIDDDAEKAVSPAALSVDHIAFARRLSNHRRTRSLSAVDDIVISGPSPSCSPPHGRTLRDSVHSTYGGPAAPPRSFKDLQTQHVADTKSLEDLESHQTPVTPMPSDVDSPPGGGRFVDTPIEFGISRPRKGVLELLYGQLPFLFGKQQQQQRQTRPAVFHTREMYAREGSEEGDFDEDRVTRLVAMAPNTRYVLRDT